MTGNVQILGTRLWEGSVAHNWIDQNGHMNVAYYVLAFDLAVGSLWQRLGIDDDYIQSTQGSTFAVESHVTYQRELLSGDPLLITGTIVAYDHRRIHQFQRLYHGSEHYLAATAEWMSLHVDLGERRVTQWPDAVLAHLEKITSNQTADLPPEVGRQMHVANPIYTMQQESND